MTISKELQIGKAGEHLVCCDLIKQGFSAFLADQGLSYDVVVDVNGRLYRIQVKTTSALVDLPKATRIYRFNIARGRGAILRFTPSVADYFAFVALDILEVAYVPISQMTARSGLVKMCMDFKSKHQAYPGRVYSNGTVRTPEWGRYLQDFKRFAP